MDIDLRLALRAAWSRLAEPSKVLANRLWEHIRRPGFAVHGGQRAYTASEVLLFESLHICVRERWSAQAHELLRQRALDQRRALLNALDVERSVSLSDEVAEQLRDSLKLMRSFFRSYGKNLGRGSTPMPLQEAVATAELWLGVMHLAVKDLPDSVRAAVDNMMSSLHRRRMVTGTGSKRRTLLNQTVHPHALIGLAISGGGIRSASFAIGVLQSLARFDVLRTFHFVSSVSGGGYAASWYLAWAYRHQSGLKGVAEDLKTPKGTECTPLWWVRRYSSYLAPRLDAAMGSDAPALFIAYVSNWLPIFILICAALTTLLMVPNAVVSISSHLNDTNAIVEAASWASVVAVIFIGFLRRLTMFYREPGDHTRYPYGLAAVVVMASALTAVVLSSTGLVLLKALATVGQRLAGDLRYPLFVTEMPSLWVMWATLHLLAIVVGVLMSTEAFQLLTDFVRRGFGVPMRVRGRLIRHSVPVARVLVGVAAASFVGAALTDWFMQFAFDPQRTRYVAALGPLLVIQVIIACELANSFASHRFLRDVDRAWSARVGGWMLTGVGTWAGLSAVALLVDDAVLVWTTAPESGKGLASCAVVAAVIFAWRRKYLVALYLLGAFVFVSLLALFFAAPLYQILAVRFSLGSWVSICVVLAITLWLGSLINVNRFSLHSLYREGLVRTFLGASRLSPRNTRVSAPICTGLEPGEHSQFQRRRPDPVTNIDEQDNPALSWLRSKPLRPLPIFLLNAAVNGRSSGDIHGRVPKQSPYTFSPYFCGSPSDGIGYSRSEMVFGGKDGETEVEGNDSRSRTTLKRNKPLTLGTAMAVSGAAVSPTSGRATHPVKAFVLGLLNARLGLWVGNPSYPNSVTQESPSLTGLAVLSEMMGIRSRFNRWIHLSDGGHFENLGIYELIRRGCLRIVVIDGSCDRDTNLSDLANAIRRARIDLGIVIRASTPSDIGQVVPVGLQPPLSELPLGSWRWFTIDYGDGLTLGRLLYIRPVVEDHRDLAIEIRQYWKSSPSFPHETTVDQFFSEAQMEAYRALGQACGDSAMTDTVSIGAAPGPSFDRALTAAILRRTLAEG